MAKREVLGADKQIHRRKIGFYPINYYIKSMFFQYYGKVEVKGLENIPKNEPVIFAPNHQNALMDALIVLFSSPGDTIFLARADLFRKKSLAYILNTLKMLPVFRIRDGVEELGKNQEIFDLTVDVLHRNHQLCLMPEGNHGSYRRLRTLGKGIFRIAFKAQEQKGNVPYVKIVPVGLDFSDYIKHNQSLQITYGKPIDVSEYWDTFIENGPRGLNHLKQRLITEMKPLMINIETEEYYDTYMGLRKIFNDQMRGILGIEGTKLHDKFKADKEMIQRLDVVLEKDESKIASLNEKTVPYFEKLKQMNLRDWVVKTKGYGFGQTLMRNLVLLLTLPIFIYGFINNAILYFLPVRLVKGIKDLQFHSSVKAGAAYIISGPISYGIQTALVAIFTPEWYYWVIYLVSVYPFGKLALIWYKGMKKTLRGAWFRRRLNRNKADALEMVQLRESIVSEMESLIGS